MEYDGLVKRIAVPAGFTVPRRLVWEDVVATAITRDDLADDVRGINASLELIRQTRGGAWPSGPVTEDFNYVDLVWHELEFRELSSFTYVSRTDAGEYLGCVYLYPMGGRTPLSAETVGFDVDVSWWVTPDAYAAGYYEKVLFGLRHWLGDEFPFWKPWFSNVAMSS